jgi:hypothetical protein
MLHTLKVVCITKGVAKSTCASATVRDGWGVPKNGPQLVSQLRDSGEAPRDAA